MRKLLSITMTAIAIGEGVIALRGFLRKLHHQRLVKKGEAMELETPNGETVICKPVGKAAADPKPHQDKPSQMGLA